MHARHLVGGGGAVALQEHELAGALVGGEARLGERVEDGGNARVRLGVALARVFQRGVRGVDELRAPEGRLVQRALPAEATTVARGGARAGRTQDCARRDAPARAREGIASDEDIARVEVPTTTT